MPASLPVDRHGVIHPHEAQPLGRCRLPGLRTVQVLPVRRSEIILPDRRGLSGAGLARIAVVLGDDLAPGRHTVRVKPHSGPPVYLRFFRAGKRPETGSALQWNRRSDGVTLEDSDDEGE